MRGTGASVSAVRLTDRGIVVVLALAVLAVWALVVGATVSRCAGFWYGVSL